MRKLYTFCLFLISFHSVVGQVCSNAQSGTISVVPTPPPGGYAAGTVVDMCFNLTDFTNTQAEWVHGIIPEFGPGWDASTIVGVSSPASCSGGGTWDFYTTWTSCNTNQVWGPGFSYDSGAGLGCGGTANDGDPGNNFGDATLCPRTFCWQVTAAAPPGSGCTAADYLVQVFVYGDAETGSWSITPPCAMDDPICWPQLTDFGASVDDPCPGDPFTLTGIAEGLPCGTGAVWTGPGGFMSTNLITTTTTEGTYTLEVGIAGCAQYTATVNATYGAFNPTLNPSPSATYCFGDPVTLTVTGGTSFTFFDPFGVPVQSGANNTYAFTATDLTAGFYTVQVNGGGAACVANLITEIIVAPQIDLMAVANPDPVCVGEDITFTVTNPNVTFFYEWAGGAGTGETYTITATTPGPQTMTLTATNLAGCSETITIPYTVVAPPNVTLTASPMMICEGDVVTLTATGGGTYLWNTNETGPVITDTPSSTTTYSVRVTGPSGCITEEFITVEVQPELAAPVISCESPTAATLNFDWPLVPGADFYEVIIDGVSQGTVTAPPFNLSGLNPLQLVTITVIPFSSNNPNCPGISATETCQVRDCDPVNILIDPIDPICVTAANQTQILIAGVPGAPPGQVTWSGPGVIVPTNPGQLLPSQLPPGITTLTVTFSLFDGSCPQSATIDVEIVEGASAALQATATDICLTETTTVSLADGAVFGANYSWDFAGATVLSGTDSGPYELSFPAAGDYTISLGTDLSGCTDMDDITISVNDTLAVPEVFCQAVSNNSVTFGWTDVGADSYTVTVLSGHTGTQNGNSFEVTGLTNGEIVSIQVTANSTGSCPSVTSAVQDCQAIACPDVMIAIDNPAQTFCDDGMNDPLLLTATITGAVNPSAISWAGPGVMGDTFDADDAGVGTHTITATIMDEGCPFTASVDFEVLAPPTSDFTIVPDLLCIGQSATITYTGDADPATATFNWDFAGGNPTSGSGAGPYEVAWSSAGFPMVTLTVTDINGCTSTETVVPAEVQAPLDAPVVECINVDLDMVTFSWADVPGATGYQVNVIAGQTGTQMGNTYTVTGMAQNESVTIEVIALGDAPCGNSPATEQTCVANACPDLMISVDNPAQTFCETGENDPVLLTATVTGAVNPSAISWSGSGLTSNSFDPDGLLPGMYTITATIMDGGCTFTADVVFTVQALPLAGFEIIPFIVCENQATTINYTGIADPANITFDWDFAGGTVISGSGSGPYQISWPAAGSYDIRLTVTEGLCTSEEIELTAQVRAPLPAPTVECANLDLDMVTFSWADVPGATGYQVTVTSGQMGTQMGNTFTVSGLAEGESVTIEVIAEGPAPCGNSPAGTATCTADVCPVLVITPSLAFTNFCLDDGSSPLLLTATPSGGVGGGTTTWSGMGVSQNGDDFFFDEEVAGLGPHTLTITYEEGGCSVVNTVDVEVFAPPTAMIDDGDGIGLALTCELADVSLSYLGNATAAATFDWDFAGAAVIPQPGFETYLLSWPSFGLYTITLSVTENGCTSEQATFDVLVSAPIGAVDLSCGASDLNSATFIWTANAEATAYELSIGGTVIDTTTDLSYTATGLQPGESVTLSVTPLSPLHPCGDGSPSSITCSADPCPTLTADFSANPTELCLDNGIISLSAIINGGSGNSAQFIWDGLGVTGDEFDPAVAGVGVHEIMLDYLEEGPCSVQASFFIEVFPIPTADFLVDIDEACEGQTITLNYDGTASALATYDWDFDGATVTSGNGQGPISINYAAAGVYTISLTVTENNCVSSTFTQNVTISAPLADPVINCINQGLEEVTFEWAAILGATGYDVVVTDGPTGILNGTTYTVTGLVPDQSVSITVQALGPAPCGDGQPISATCAAAPCPDITIDIATPAQSFCLDNNVSSVQLLASTVGGDMSGNFSWSGMGVEQIGPDFFFNPTIAGLGDWTLTVDYVETAGCSAMATLTMSVVEVPTADFSISADPICVGEAVTITYSGSAGPNAIYDWDFVGATVTDLGNETYSLVWTSAGMPVISLTVTEGGCSSDNMQGLTVVEPLVAPAPTCGLATLTEVTFDWPAVPGATGYIISTDASEVETIAGTSYTLTGLDPGQVVNFTIIAEGPAPCGNTEAVSISCATNPCPNLSINVGAPQTVFCADGLAGVQDLTAAIIGGIGAEVASWTGAGVSESFGQFQFDPTGLTPGDYTLTASYNEGGVCSFSETLVMTINAEPVAAFSLSENLICANSTTTLNLGGVMNSDAQLDWDFGGATVIDNGNGSFNLSWPTAGSYMIRLEINQNGCTDMVDGLVMVEEAPEAGMQSVALERCPADGSPTNLSNLLTGADPGGSWSVLAGTPGGTVDPTTGVLNSSSLQAGTYSYLYTVPSAVCGDATAQVDVTIQPIPVADAGEDQTLTCAMGMVSLNGTNSDSGDGFTYEWTADDPNIVISDPNSRMIDVAQDGLYQIRVTSNIGCSNTDEVVVRAETEVPIPQVDISNISCFSADDGAIQITEVTGGRPPYTYTLNGNDMGSSGFFPGLVPAEYELRVTDANGCFSELFLDVTQPDQLAVSLAVVGESTEVEEGELVTVTARVSGGNAIDTLIWEPDSLGQVGEGNAISFLADETREIRLTVVDELGCRATDNLTIIVRKGRPVFIPTGISPNGDNSNDVLLIYADNDQVEEIESFLVFNRWGESIFENYDFLPNDPVEGWDGTHRGQTLNPAVFVYVAVIRFTDGEVLTYSGDVTLVR
ncbi:MAG: PKD domain-containing protein [Bacteroidota bacterium]